MAAALSLLPTAHSHHHHYHHLAIYCKSHQTPPSTLSPPQFKRPSQPFYKFNRSGSTFLTPSFSASPSSSSSSPVFLYPQNALAPGRFLTPEELEKLQFLENFTYSCKLASGYLSVRVMRIEEIDKTSTLLAGSFAESMLLPIGYYSEEEGSEEEQLAGTVEMSFDKRGANASPPTPTPPKNCPYICNMTVKEQLRRRGIGWHLLKASEELISQMSSSRKIYLHCRMIDSAPFSMYKKAGYDVVQTDSILILLTLQRRKHLMCKKLPDLTESSEMAVSVSEEETSS
ncbi:hypothetical protein Ancab_020549 [Ancistrocladus abbreviatus]